MYEYLCDERLKEENEVFIIRGKGRPTENIYKWVSV